MKISLRAEFNAIVLMFDDQAFDDQARDAGMRMKMWHLEGRLKAQYPEYYYQVQECLDPQSVTPEDLPFLESIEAPTAYALGYLQALRVLAGGVSNRKWQANVRQFIKSDETLSWKVWRLIRTGSDLHKGFIHCLLRARRPPQYPQKR